MSDCLLSFIVGWVSFISRLIIFIVSTEHLNMSVCFLKKLLSLGLSNIKSVLNTIMNNKYLQAY